MTQSLYLQVQPGTNVEEHALEVTHFSSQNIQRALNNIPPESRPPTRLEYSGMRAEPTFCRVMQSKVTLKVDRSIVTVIVLCLSTRAETGLF